MTSLRDSFVGTAAVLKLRLSGTRFPPVANAAGQRSLFIGPTNNAGQSDAWARSVEAYVPGLQAVSMAFVRKNDRFGFSSDQPVRHEYAVHSRAWRTRQYAAVAEFEAVILESGVAPFTKLFGGNVTRQVDALKEEGARVALLFHGSDIRDPDLHRASEPHTPFAEDDELTTALRKLTATNRTLIAQTNVQVFVSTLGLLSDVPDAQWLPVAVEMEQWAGATSALRADGRLRVVHLPSSSKMKGTELVEPVLRELSTAETIDYRAAHGVPHAEMPGIYRSADIVLDQFAIGDYGVAACEALAAGRLVVGHVTEVVRQRVLDYTGAQLPIVEATPETLANVLIEIDSRREEYAQIAAQGPGFVRDFHDGRRSAQIISEWMGLR